MSSDWKAEADKLLKDIACWESTLRGIEDEMGREIEMVRKRYETNTATLRKAIDGAAKSLKAIMARREDVFGERDRIELKHGALLWSKSWPVVKSPGTWKRLLEDGREDLLAIEYKPKWAEIGKLPDDALENIGLRRQLKEKFDYTPDKMAESGGELARKCHQEATRISIQADNDESSYDAMKKRKKPAGKWLNWSFRLEDLAKEMTDADN